MGGVAYLALPLAYDALALGRLGRPARLRREPVGAGPPLPGDGARPRSARRSRPAAPGGAAPGRLRRRRRRPSAPPPDPRPRGRRGRAGLVRPGCGRRGGAGGPGPGPLVGRPRWAAGRPAAHWPRHSGPPQWPASSACRGSSAWSWPGTSPSTCSGWRPRRRGRPRGGRSCASRWGPSACRRWPGASPSPPRCRCCSARGPRFRWAGRCWSIALVSWVLAWIGGTGVDRRPGGRPDGAAGPGRRRRGRWRSAWGSPPSRWTCGPPPSGGGRSPRRWRVGALALGTCRRWSPPSPAGGRCPRTTSPRRWRGCTARPPAGAFRVLWLGDPRGQPGLWSAGDGLAYATSQDGTPDATWLWNGTAPGPAAGLASPSTGPRRATDRLGALLAPAGVRYVVVLTALAPVIPATRPHPLPGAGRPDPGLARQLDSGGLDPGRATVYENTDWIPQRAGVTASAAAAGTRGGARPPDHPARSPGGGRGHPGPARAPPARPPTRARSGRATSSPPWRRPGTGSSRWARRHRRRGRRPSAGRPGTRCPGEARRPWPSTGARGPRSAWCGRW